MSTEDDEKMTEFETVLLRHIPDGPTRTAVAYVFGRLVGQDRYILDLEERILELERGRRS